MVRDHPLGLVISSKIDAAEEATSNEVPAKGPVPLASPPPLFFINDGDQPILRSHIAKANPHWEQLVSVEEFLVVFQGENNEVTLSWYPSKEEHHRAVPTWSYEIVQMRGTPVLQESPDWRYKQVSRAANTLERDRIPLASDGCARTVY